ncbi:mediator of RNA polymerase II transcription subunit 18 [Penicillium argentinense]|uniref:Mediator of RNA polymerase II transcription subunit 18 n=1 Tax=Penicillium argentinense TaxID=1131581 RepID=A0A9W9JXU4_9EURO|nr:mediator of RNA polymerase II transcription subunit 18 [Penicillium argentinense]KAJ5085558.1 mediator of RNA polymerase II transcription subunit 18 [Penicillium argentinense]
MHELLLFASVPVHQHAELLQQLAGLTGMQPRHCFERRLIFKAYRKPGQPNARVGASQDLQKGDLQRVNKMLNGGMFYTQLVGSVQSAHFGAAAADAVAGGAPAAPPADPDTNMDGMDEANPPLPRKSYDFDQQRWSLEFRDIPEAGTRSGVTARVMATAALPAVDVVQLMNAWGYSFVTEYIVEGDMFVQNDTAIYLHRVLHYPTTGDQEIRSPRRQLPNLDQMAPLEKTGSYVLQASITVQDSTNQDAMKTASQHLFALREQLRSAVKLEPADRLALDTRVK